MISFRFGRNKTNSAVKDKTGHFKSKWKVFINESRGYDVIIEIKLCR